jgi:hypothetical protein
LLQDCDDRFLLIGFHWLYGDRIVCRSGQDLPGVGEGMSIAHNWAWEQTKSPNLLVRALH